MALVLADRVRDVTTTTGTGTVTLSGTAPTGYQTFGAAIGNGNTTYYTIVGGSEWEVGVGTYTSSGTTLSRDTVLASSNSGSLVSFSAGDKDVFVTYPAGRSIQSVSPTFDTSIFAPLVNGGTGASSTLTLQSTSGTGTSDAIVFKTASQAEAGRFTTKLFFETVFSDKVVAIGNSGTAATIDLTLGNVFTATLTGNCTFTLSNPNANSSRGSSFTLILTNDATPSRSVAWSGGSFLFPGGAATLSRSTAASATDVWVFFTPDQGTTWYGNIAMKDMKA